MPVWINELFYLAVNLLALTVGGREERLTGGLLLARQIVAYFALDRTWPDVQWALFALDSTTFAIFLVLALRSAKFWPLYLCAFQLLSVGTHFGKLLDRGTQQWAYITALLIW